LYDPEFDTPATNNGYAMEADETQRGAFSPAHNLGISRFKGCTGGGRKPYLRRRMDLELAEKWPSGWEGRLAYTVQDIRDKATHTLLTNSPKHLPKLEVIVPVVPRQLFLGVNGQYESRRQ
jgi:hypothetical protein